MPHTIVLVQTTGSRTSRSFHDYEQQGAAMDGICQMYEAKLKSVNPTLRQITYDIADLFTFIDQLGDLSCLVFEDSVGAYRPYGKDWIKQKVFQRLKGQAEGGA